MSKKGPFAFVCMDGRRGLLIQAASAQKWVSEHCQRDFHQKNIKRFIKLERRQLVQFMISEFLITCPDKVNCFLTKKRIYSSLFMKILEKSLFMFFFHCSCLNSLKPYIIILSIKYVLIFLTNKFSIFQFLLFNLKTCRAM
jgi:hypothetical protein